MSTETYSHGGRIIGFIPEWAAIVVGVTLIGLIIALAVSEWASRRAHRENDSDGDKS